MENELINALANEIINKLKGKIFSIEKDMMEFLQSQVTKIIKKRSLNNCIYFNYIVMHILDLIQEEKTICLQMQLLS